MIGIRLRATRLSSVRIHPKTRLYHVPTSDVMASHSLQLTSARSTISTGTKAHTLVASVGTGSQPLLL